MNEHLFFFSSSSTVKLSHSRFTINEHTVKQTNFLGSSLYLKGDDETQSDGEELPVEERVTTAVVSEGFISTTYDTETQQSVDG